MMRGEIFMKKILIVLVLLIILFNDSSTLFKFMNFSYAEEIEVEALDENKASEENEDNPESEEGEKIEVEELYDNMLMDSSLDNNLKDSILYDNNTIKENRSGIEIDNDKTIEEAEIHAEVKINKKVALEDGLFVEELLKISINRNNSDINSAILSLDNFEYDGFNPIYCGIEGKNNISTTNKIKIVESEINNSKDVINLEYKLELVYPKEVENIDEIKLGGKIVLENDYENVTREIEASDKNEDEIESNNSNLEINFTDDNIYKSYMRASRISTNNFDTEYNQSISIDIENNGLNEWYDIDTGIDEFETNETNIVLNDEIKFIQTEISKNNFGEILGSDGFIEIYNNDQIIGVIDSNTEIVNDNYVYKYNEIFDRLTFRIIGANAGHLDINNKKAIIGTDKYTNGMISRINGIKTSVIETVQTSFGDKDFVIKSDKKDQSIVLTETYSKAILEIDNTVFSTNIENEVSFNIDLDTTSEKYELFKEPSFEILLPSMIKDVEIDSVTLLNKNGLSLDTWNVVEKENGNKSIVVNLKGAQQEFNPGASLPGTKIIIDTKLSVNDLTPTGATNIKMTYTNGTKTKTAYEMEGETSFSCEASYYSNAGIISLTQVDNYNNEGEKIYHLENDSPIGRLDTNGDEKIASMDVTFVNNYNKDVNNVVVIGRIPAIGMVYSNLEKVNTTFDTRLKDRISTSGLLSKVYYSNKLDCGIEDESWVEEPDELSDIKSFKIEIEGGVMSHGELEKISYQLVIPEKLGINQKAYNVCTIYYDYENQNCKKETSIKLETDTATISLDECQNNFDINDKELSVGTRATYAGVDLQDGEEVYYGQMIKYAYVIKNNSKTSMKNIKLEGSVHNGNMYYKEVYDNYSSTDGSYAPICKYIEDVDGTHRTNEDTIEELKPGETYIYTYQVFARNNQPDGSKDVYGILKLSGEGINEREVKTISNNILDSEFELEITPGQSERADNSNAPCSNGYDFTIRVRNNTNETKDNVVVRVDLPKLITLNEWKSIAISHFFSGYEENDTQNIAQFTIDHLPANQDYYLSLPTLIGNLDLDTYTEDFTVIAKVNYNDKTYYSNDFTRAAQQIRTKFDSKITANPKDGSVVSKGDKIEYNVEIENKGLVRGFTEVATPLSKGLKLDSLEYLLPDGTKETYGEADGAFDSRGYLLNPGEKVYITIKCTVEQMDFSTDQDKIVFNTESEAFESNSITYYINSNDIIHSGWGKSDASDDVYDEEQEPLKSNYDEIPDVVVNNNEETDYTDVEDTVDNNDYDEEINEPIDNTRDNKSDDNTTNSDVRSGKNSLIDIFGALRRSEDNLEEEDTPRVTQTSFVKTTNKYTISGLVWMDSNKDGVNTNEDAIPDIDVYLYKDEINDNTKASQTKTNSDGKYYFDKVEEGNYFVVFDYNNDNYSITKVNSNNKDAVVSRCTKAEYNLNNQAKSYAVSEMISLNENTTEINLGLTNNSIFDFEIKSNIENVYVKYGDEYKEYKFTEKDKLPKIELNRKKANSAIVSVKYRIQINNVGNTSGYILQLKDVLPEGFRIDEKQNVNWSIGNDNAIYYYGLSKEKINPSGSKTFYLIAYKEIGDERLGTFKNQISINETSNDELLEDTNKDNNTVSQDVIISISTGAMTYIILVAMIIVLLAFIIILISNKLISDIKYKKTIIKLLMLLFILLALILLLINTYGADNSGTDDLLEVAGNRGTIYDTYDELADAINSFDIYPTTGKRYRTGGGQEQLNERRVQCIEGLDVSGSISNGINTYGEGRGIGSIMEFWSDGDKYKTYAINATYYSGSSASDANYKYYASRFAFIGWAAEQDYAGGQNIWDRKHSVQYMLYHAATASNKTVTVTNDNKLTEMIGYSYSMDLNGTELSDETSFAGTYATLSLGLKDFKAKINDSDHKPAMKKVDESVTELNFNDDGLIGPIHVKCPVNSIGSYSKTINGSTYHVGGYIYSELIFWYYDAPNASWKYLACDIYYGGRKVASTGTNGRIVKVNDSFYDISNKEIYLKVPDNIIGNISKIDIQNTRNEFESKGLSFFETTNYINSDNSYQDIVCLRGKLVGKSSEVVWNFVGYKVDVNKYIYKKYRTNGTTLFGEYSYNRSSSSESYKSSTPAIVDARDLLMYRIDVKNIGVELSSVTVKDDFDNRLEYVGYSIKDDGTTTDVGKWTKSSNTFSYNEKIARGATVSFYILFKPKTDAIDKANVDLNNKATITVAKAKNVNITSKLIGSKLESVEKVRLRTYYIDADKYVVKINSSSRSNESTSYVEPGDTVIMEVKVNNHVSDNKNYGSIHNIKLTDVTTFTNGYDKTKYFDLVGFSTSMSGTYAQSVNSDGIKVVKDQNDNYRYNITINQINTTEGSNSKSIFVKYYVKTTIKDVNLLLENHVDITGFSNINGVDLFNIKNKVNVEDISTKASMYIKKYNSMFIKQIMSVNSTQEGNTLTSKGHTCETGDIVTFRVSFKNMGRSTNLNGNFRLIEIKDAIDTNAFKFIDYTGNTNDITYNNNSNLITYRNNTNGLRCNETTYVDIRCKVIYKSSVTAVLSNTATVRKVLNKNNIELYNNGSGIDLIRADSNRMTDTKTLNYQVYNYELNKYITHAKYLNTSNYTSIDGRKNMDITQRYDNPVEIEKGESVLYRIDLKNASTRNNNDNTNLYRIVLLDTTEDGIEPRINELSVKDGSGRDISFTKTYSNHKITITFNQAFVLAPKSSINIQLPIQITKSNFYLYNLENMIEISSIKNRNNIDIKEILNENNPSHNKEYVRLRNLVVSGNIWNDVNENGLKNTGEKGIEGIEVRLIDITNRKFVSTSTNTDGYFRFENTNQKGHKINNLVIADGALSYTETNTEDPNQMVDTYNRVIKATNRNDATGNYDRNSSQYIEYVLEYIYDGVHYYTTNYAGTNNINMSNLSINNNYRIDSNARESILLRDEFYDSLDTLYYNKAQNKEGTERNVDYIKDGHVSELEHPLYLKAYSFGDGYDITPLWLHKTNNDVQGESEYLKYINLGLIFKSADLEVSNDLTSITTYINGEKVEYNYAQGDDTNSDYAKPYRTGGEEQDLFYKFKIYSSDYYYQSRDYDNANIRNYKKDTELEIQAKYKITIYNKCETNKKTYARIKELTDYYSKTFRMDLDNKITVKVYDDEGNLVSTQLNTFVVDPDYNYSTNINYPDMSGSDCDLNKVYLQTPIDIAEGGKAEFYLTYTIDKEEKTLSTGEKVNLLKINNELVRNIIEINTYSIYLNNTETPFGLIDDDSNPGNRAKEEDVSQYEDDTYEARLQITKRTDPGEDPGGGNSEDTERTITGYVWEDARSETINENVGTQYLGNGIFSTSDTKNKNAMSLDGSADNDHKVPGVTVHLVEEIRIKQADGSYKLYEYDWANRESKAYNELSTIKNQCFTSTTNNIGVYELKAMIPGIYKVRFSYGKEDKNGTIGDLHYNGQDFKSTKYTGITQDTNSINTLFGYEAGVNADLKAMGGANKNDAMDDELRRLECMTYAEIQTNSNQSILNQTRINNSTGAEKEAAKKEYVDKTYMFADTGFIRLNTELTKNSSDEIELNKKSYSFTEGSKIFDKVQYSYKVNNIDFGMEYRPKTAVSLNKFMKEFKIVLSDGTVLAEAIFDEVYDLTTHALVGTVLNEEKTTGRENIMVMAPMNDKDRGAIAVTVDNSIIRGASITINYILATRNEGEIDRISLKLDNIRNEFEEVLSESAENELLSKTISAVAYKRLSDKFGQVKINNTTINNLGKNLSELKYKYLYNAANGVGYYGEYLGNTYYNGNPANDVIAKTKVNNIIDYVPTGLDFDQDQNIGKNHYWTSIADIGKAEEYIDDSVFETRHGGDKNIYDIFGKTYYDYSSKKSNLAMSVDEYSYVENDSMQNRSLSRLLIPNCADDYSLNNGDGATKSSGIIYLTTAITLSPKEENDTLWYTNEAEIGKITSQTGRVTPTQKDRIDVGSDKRKPETSKINVPAEIRNNETFQREIPKELWATMGNFKPRLLFSAIEADSAVADPLIIVDPTGIVPLYLKLNSKMVFSLTLGVITILAIIIIGTKKKLAIKKILKRKKINISLKKYYK